MSALLTYRSRNSFQSRFGRKTIQSKNPETETHQEKAMIYHNEGNKLRLHEPKASLEPIPNEGPSIYSAQCYLRYQGDKFTNRFDANCYIAITRKLDTHDISRGRGEYESVLKSIQQPTCVIGIDSDGLFTLDEQGNLPILYCRGIGSFYPPCTINCD